MSLCGGGWWWWWYEMILVTRDLIEIASIEIGNS